MFDSFNQSFFLGKMGHDFVLCELIKLKCLSFTCISDNFAAKNTRGQIHGMCTRG